MHPFHGRGFDGFGDLPVARKDLGSREILLSELGSEFGTAEDAGELGEQRLGTKEFQRTLAGRFDQPLGCAAPQQRGGDDVGVKDDAHGLREARRAPP